MHSLRMILMSGVAAVSLAATPALAQQATDATAGDQTDGQATRSFDADYAGDFAAWGDRTVDELLGTQVVNDDGEVIGDIDNFGLAEDRIVAIVGIGGFLGIGEHEVAVPIDQFVAEGDRLLLSGVTREDLEAMPEYDEQQSPAFAADQTLRSGYEAGAPRAETDTAAIPDRDAQSEPMDDVEEEVAEAAEAAQDGDTASEVAEATEDAAESVTGDDGAQMAEGEATEAPAEETEMAGSDAAQQPAEGEGAEMAEGETTEPPAEDTEMAGTDAAPQPAEGEDTEMAEGETTEPQAEDTEMAGTDAAPQPAEGEGAEMVEGVSTQPPAERTDMAGTDPATGWTEEMDQIFADIADRQIAELIGMEVAGAEGDVVGEVDNFALEGEDVVAIVGVGGFFGIGEHDVALPLGEMTFDGERLVLNSITQDQLRDMPAYENTEENALPQDGTLRTTYDQ